MPSRRSRIKLALAIVIAAALGALLWRPIQQARAVAALQGAVRGAGFRFEYNDRLEGLTAVADEWIDKAARQLGGGSRGPIFTERLRPLYHGAIRSLTIMYPDVITGDPGAALTRFGDLRDLRFDDGRGAVTETDWKQLCISLRSMPKLEGIELVGANLTNAAFAPLSGHPALSRVDVRYAKVTAGFVATIATLPSLTNFSIDVTSDGLTGADWVPICAALRSLTQLETLGLSESHLNDAALAPLAGHPSLRELIIIRGRLTPGCAASLARIPHLTRLTICNVVRQHSPPQPFFPDERAAFARALPGVELILP